MVWRMSRLALASVATGDWRMLHGGITSAGRSWFLSVCLLVGEDSDDEHLANIVDYKW